MTENNPSPNDEIDDEIELEPVDPEILEHRRRRTIEKIRKAEDTIDVNAGFDDLSPADPINFDDLKRFRFTMRHLMTATAVLSIAMTLFLRLGNFMGLFVSAVVALAAGWWLVLREENRKKIALETQQKKLAARIARQRAIEDGKSVEPIADDEIESDNATSDDANAASPAFKFSFSMKEMFGALTAAAVILGLSRFLGQADMVVVLGVIALAGLIIQATGFSPSPIIVLLALYLLFGLFGAFGDDEQTAQLSPGKDVVTIHSLASNENERSPGFLSLPINPSLDLTLQHVQRHCPTAEYDVMKSSNIESLAQPLLGHVA